MDNSDKNLMAKNMKLAGKSKKKLIILSSIGALFLIVLATVLTLAFTVWSQPSKQDFAEARKQLESVNQSAAAVSQAAQAYSDEVKKAKEVTPRVVEKLDGVIKRHNDNLEKLSESKALRDEEVQKKYEAFKSVVPNFTAFSTNRADLIAVGTICQGVFNVFSKGADLPSRIDDHDEVAKKCLVATDRLQQSAIEDFAEYGSKTGDIVRERQRILAEYKNEGTALIAVLEKLSTATKKYSQTTDAPNITKASKAANVSSEYKELKDILQRKEKE